MVLLLQQVLQWWIVFFALGIFALPIAITLFSSFFDKGYVFAKTIGLLCISYVAYVLGTLHILPFTTSSLIGIGIVFALASTLLARKNKTLDAIKKHWMLFAFEEGLFLICLFVWSFVKSFQPDVHGLEKFMDYGFINSILRTNYFPAKDMWMAPLSINYYYFGHIATAVLTKLSFLPSNTTFNLMLASIFGFTFTGGFSIGGNLVYMLKNHMKHLGRGGGRRFEEASPLGRKEDALTSRAVGAASKKLVLLGEPQVIFAGLLTALLLTFAGNLHTIYTFFTPYQNDSPVPPMQLAFSPQTFPNQYWYPNATRFIYHTIHEFPMYSFVVSDLHGHVLDIPNVLLMIALLLVIFLEPIGNVSSRGRWAFGPEIGNSLLLGSIAGLMYMTNAWDGLIYVGIIAILLFIKSFSKSTLQTFFSKKFTFSILTLFVSFIVVSLPFSFFFKPFASQIGINCAPDFLIHIGNIGPIVFESGYCQHSPLWQLAILYGFFFFWFVSFLTYLYMELKTKGKLYTIDLFVLGLGICGFFLILLPEFVYLKDIYTTYFRANTMFKLVYQAFILLSLVSGYTIYRIFSEMKHLKKNFAKRFFSFFFFLFSFVLILLVMIYPYFSITSYFNNLKDFQGLNGTNYLKNISIDDYNAIQWLNVHISGQPVLLEAQGDSYTDYERISSNTGLPTVFGWMVHEWLWRGTYNIVPGRVADVKTIYESKDSTLTRALLSTYNISYVYIGDMERSKYPGIDEAKFAQLGKIIYASGSVKIYKIQ